MQRTETHIAMAEMPAKDYASVLLETMCDATDPPRPIAPANSVADDTAKDTGGRGR
jgi:hypothetical protein